VNYITDEVKAFIGFESDYEVGWDPVERGQIRRHVQAVMDDDPIYVDDDYAASTRFGGVVAPPLFPLHAVTRWTPGQPDPLEPALRDPDFDGAPSNMLRSCVLPPIPLKRILNGGSDFEIYQLARPGERIGAQSRYVDIFQKEGRSGTMVFWLIETRYTNAAGDLLLKSTNTRILR
jgi:hypothetical protein